MPPENVLLKIESFLPDLRPSEQKIANYVLENPTEVKFQTVNEVASNSNVSDASVMRFVKTLGFKGFQEFKLALASLPEEKGGPTEIKEISEGTSISELKTSIKSNFNLSVDNTTSILNETDLQKSVDYIQTAEDIFVIGVGASGIMARLLAYKLLRMGIATNFISDPHLQSMYASLTDENNLIIALSHSGSTKDTVDTLQLAQKAGADTICITDHVKSPITQYSDVLLSTYSKKDPLGFSQGRSSASQCYVIETLCACLYAQSTDEIKDSHRKTAEAVLDKLY